jgi:hypothetical protein
MSLSSFLNMKQALGFRLWPVTRGINNQNYELPLKVIEFKETSFETFKGGACLFFVKQNLTYLGRRFVSSRSQWSAAVRLLVLLVRMPPGAWMSVSCECCVLSGRVLCLGVITRVEESYRVWCVCDREASILRRPWPTRGCCAIEKKLFLTT